MPILKQFLKILEKKYIYFQKYNKNLLEMIDYVLLIQEIIKKD